MCLWVGACGCAVQGTVPVGRCRQTLQTSWPRLHMPSAVAPDCPGCGSTRSMQTSTGWLRSGACVEAGLCSRWASALKVLIGASPCQSAVKGATSGGPVYGGFVSGGLLRRVRVLARLLGLGPAVVN